MTQRKGSCLSLIVSIFFNRTAYVSNYQDSLFYQLEETLKKEKLTKYNE